ncbi:MAG TPA: c-type cytochrome domain-containing protein [Puia sp.]|nr:c-type cytochrome domain-containing protein [Puia sp.]
MMKWKNILFSITLAANCLLCFLLIFYDKLVVPSLLQVVGRSHPLFLHFPIVLFILFICWIWFVPKRNFHSAELFENISKWLLLATAFTSAITALMGLFLSREAGYNPDSLFWHKWSGALVSVITFLWYAFYDRLQTTKIVLAGSSLFSAIVLLIAGHQGASITHGDNFLLAPVESNKIKKVPIDEAIVFTDMVKPILDNKCMSCHNNKKAKGDLIMETQQLLMKGGKNGVLWDTSDVNMSLILQRIHLPVEEKKHMPPNGKPQLNEQEMAILYNWIKRGANFKIKVTELEPTDTLKTIASNIFKSDEEENYDFSAASDKTIQKLNSNFRAVYSLAKNSPAVAVDFYGAAFFKPEQLKDLLEIKTQLVSLNLDKMPVTDNDLQTIGQLTNLRNLNLSFSKVSGAGLASLNKLTHLKTISLTNTAVKKDDIQQLASLKELRHIYIWNTAVNLADAESIRKKYPAVDIQTGSRTDTMFLKINPPVLLTDANVIVDTPIQLRLKHFVPGINIRYTLDGTLPDSINSLVYDNKTYIDKPGLMKARAFKKGWHGSDSISYRFYQATYKADTVILLHPTDSNYKGKGGRTLNDFVKGNEDFGNGKWIAFRKDNMECMMVFSKPITPKNITVSSIVNVGALVFPPKDIKIFGGMDAKNLKPLYHFTPAQDTMPTSNYLIPYECKITPVTLKYIKVVVEPIGKLPKQFLPEKPKEVVADKKDKNVTDKKDKNVIDKKGKDVAAKKEKKPNPLDSYGWLFLDEIFVN